MIRQQVPTRGGDPAISAVCPTAATLLTPAVSTPPAKKLSLGSLSVARPGTPNAPLSEK